jgi:hypothetical protein
VDDPKPDSTENTPDEQEDHREGPPGYDLDEQAAIEELRESEGDE